MMSQLDGVMSGSIASNQRMSPSRISRGRFSPTGGGVVGRGTLQNVLAGRASRQSPYGGSRATFSRAGGASRAGSVRDPNGVAADLDNINIHSPDQIEKERLYKQKYNDLKRQFESIDLDHNGFVDRNELIEYMVQLTGNRLIAENADPQ